jgi:3-phenylpropionate/trans-cinnamate dioxygenase ferredoxin subunit
MARHVVAAAGEIPPGGRKLVAGRGRDIAVFNVAGE